MLSGLSSDGSCFLNVGLSYFLVDNEARCDILRGQGVRYMGDMRRQAREG